MQQAIHILILSGLVESISAISYYQFELIIGFMLFPTETSGNHVTVVSVRNKV